MLIQYILISFILKISNFFRNFPGCAAVEPVVYDEHNVPRLFAFCNFTSGLELLRGKDLSDFLCCAQEDPGSVILMEPLADCSDVTSITVLQPLRQDPSQEWLTKYKQDSIVPWGLRSRCLTSLPAVETKKEGPKFGTNVGSGLEIGSIAPKPQQFCSCPKVCCPPILEMRQIFQYQPVCPDKRNT